MHLTATGEAIPSEGSQGETLAMPSSATLSGRGMFTAGVVMSFSAAAAVASLWLFRPASETVSFAAVSGRRSMELRATLNCRLVPRDEPGYRYLGSTEIPSPVPRHELVDSIQQWAANELKEQLEAKHFGFRMVVDYEDDRVVEGDTFSLTVRFIAPTDEYIVLEYCLDNETVKVARTIEGFKVEDKERQILGRDGTPDVRSISLLGTESEVSGRFFMVRRKEGPMPDVLRPMVSDFLKETAMALTRYYAFG
eukprot:EG_transcript_21028